MIKKMEMMEKKKRSRGHMDKHRSVKAFLAFVISMIYYSSPVYATDAIITKVNSIYSLVVGIVAAAGAIVLAWGIFEFATAYQSHDSSTQTQALKKVVSGIIMCGASALVNLLK